MNSAPSTELTEVSTLFEFSELSVYDSGLFC